MALPFSSSEILKKTVEDCRRKQLLEQANRDYAALRADPEAWQTKLEERQAWEATLLDGFENDPYD